MVRAERNHRRPQGFVTGDSGMKSTKREHPMMKSSGATTSLWMATAEIPSRPPLTKDMTADVCVVGAGIAGLTTAYLLVDEGRSVVVLDDGGIASGETSRTTAHLVTALDDRYFALENLHGEKGARLAAESHRSAIDRIEAIMAREKIDCEFERLDGYLFAPPGESSEVLDKELAAAHRAGLTDVERVARAPLQAFDTGPLSAVSAPGAVSSAEVSGRFGAC